MNPAEIIKKSVSTKAACFRYGIELNRIGFARCPFHYEKTASFKVYPGDKGWHCFGCNRSGDVIDLVRELFGLSFTAACERLSDDFGVKTGTKGKVSNAQKIVENKAAWDRRKSIERIEKLHRQLIDEWNDAIRDLRLVEMLFDYAKPTDREEEWHEAFVYALEERATARHRADVALEALNDFEKQRYSC